MTVERYGWLAWLIIHVQVSRCQVSRGIGAVTELYTVAVTGPCASALPGILPVLLCALQQSELTLNMTTKLLASAPTCMWQFAHQLLQQQGPLLLCGLPGCGEQSMAATSLSATVTTTPMRCKPCSTALAARRFMLAARAFGRPLEGIKCCC
jgi:hypothetical protein